MPYDPTIYAGAAGHYRPGRPPYSPQLEALLSSELGLDGRGGLLDVGCGPGILTLRLAPLFERAVGLDPDPGMLGEARHAAAACREPDIEWVQACAEDLPDAAPGPYRLITFGQSFWWTDRARVAEITYDLLSQGGALVLIHHKVEGREAPPSPGPPSIPHDLIRAVVERYLGATPRAGQGIRVAPAQRAQDLLAETRFGDTKTVFAPGVPDLLRDTESVLSGYFSLSTSAPHLFGARVDEFAAEVRQLLNTESPDGFFWDWPGDTEVTLARKP